MAKKSQLKIVREWREAGFSLQEAKEAAGMAAGEQIRLPVFPTGGEIETGLEEIFCAPEERSSSGHGLYAWVGWAALQEIVFRWHPFVCQIVKESFKEGVGGIMFFRKRKYEHLVKRLQQLFPE